jgi:hypothetical protein
MLKIKWRDNAGVERNQLKPDHFKETKKKFWNT